MSPYEILGVSQAASEAEIKKAYRKLCAKHHPDSGGSLEEFQKIQKAYESIKKGVVVQPTVIRRQRVRYVLKHRTLFSFQKCAVS